MRAWTLVLSVLVSIFPNFLSAQTLDEALSGKEVMLKLDMPGSKEGVDLRFDRSTPMDWKDYTKRLKEYGVAIHKGETARITSIVLKGNRIEFQLNGGGFGTFGDDTSTTVEAKVTPKSDLEKNLEDKIANELDDDRKRSLQRDLDRERARREHQDQLNKRDAQDASERRKDEVAGDRSRGGSRFNLRWSGKVPEDAATPAGVEHLLSEYVSFDTQPNATPASHPAGDVTSGSATAHLQQGMSLLQVAALLGEGRQTSETTSAEGLITRTLEYPTSDRLVTVTFVNDVVVRYAISSK